MEFKEENFAKYKNGVINLPKNVLDINQNFNDFYFAQEGDIRYPLRLPIDQKDPDNIFSNRNYRDKRISALRV